MVQDLLNTHAILHVFFTVFAVYIMLKLGSDIARQRETRVFRRLITAFIVYLWMSGLWTLQEYDAMRLPHWLFSVICLCSLGSLSANGFLFFSFTMLHLAPETAEKRWFRAVSLAPLAIIAVCLVASLFNGMVFSTSPDNHVSFNWAYPVEPALTALYVLAILVISVVKALKSSSPSQRRQDFTLAASMLFILLCVAIDATLDKITILPMAVFAAIFFVFISMQESGIYSDALTGMNNRRKADEFLSAQVTSLSEAEPMYLYMMDINSFKQINDQYGHAEGDRALVLLANTLKRAISCVDGFAARYGGDEFILMHHQKARDGQDPEALISRIKADLADACARKRTAYEISVSAGYARCTNPKTSPEQYIRQADEMLYTRKSAFHGQRKSA